MERGTLKEGEAHPMAEYAFNWIIKSYDFEKLLTVREALASCAIENNRLAEVCLSTLNRILNREPVSDRYLLGLAWYLRGLPDAPEDE